MQHDWSTRRPLFGEGFAGVPAPPCAFLVTIERLELAPRRVAAASRDHETDCLIADQSGDGESGAKDGMPLSVGDVGNDHATIEGEHTLSSSCLTWMSIVNALDNKQNPDADCMARSAEAEPLKVLRWPIHCSCHTTDCRKRTTSASAARVWNLAIRSNS